MRIWVVLCVILGCLKDETHALTCPPSPTCPPQVTCPPQPTTPANDTLCPGYGHLYQQFQLGQSFLPANNLPRDRDPCLVAKCTESGFHCTYGCKENCPGVFKPRTGSCCGECHECIYKGRTRKKGPFIDTDDRCISCICHGVGDGYFPGNVTCTRINCTGHPEPMCKKEHLSSAYCCPTCMCPVEGTADSFYGPGPFGRKCQGCSCENGTFSCTPDEPLCKYGNRIMCVDSLMDDDCCRYCPRGVTCMAGKGKKRVIIKPGQTVMVGKKLCKCSTDPWNANAMCVKMKISTRLQERNDYQFAEFPLPETVEGIKP